MMIRGMMAAAALLCTAGSLQAALPADAPGSWAAWYGCWRAVDDAPGMMVCALPGDAPTTVRLVTVEGGSVTGESVLRADGVSRPVAEGGCSGSERAFFSSDGRRVFTRAELTCGGVERTSTGVIGMLSEVEWIDAQAVRVGDQHAGRSVRYREVSPGEIPASIRTRLPVDDRLARESARLYAAAPLDVAAVVEASHAIDAPAVEALLGARQEGFGLNGDKLRQLTSLGVPASTIDVMVALSYPTRFAVTERAPDYGVPASWHGSRVSYGRECYDPYWTNRRYSSSCYDSRYTGLGYNRGHYSPYGYDPYGWRHGGGGVVVIVRPEREPSQGSLLKGRGYTRTGAAAGAAAPRGGESTTRTTTRGTSSGSTAKPAAVKPAEKSGGSSSAKPAETKSGSSTPARTAKPRDNNE